MDYFFSTYRQVPEKQDHRNKLSWKTNDFVLKNKQILLKVKKFAEDLKKAFLQT